MSLVALLMFAAGFGLGLFFGWLLHRERVERALYEDVMRARDRATATLAETSARLELANKDMVRLRGQLSDAQYQLQERDARIAELEASALTTVHVMTDLDLFDEDDDADITEEVPLAAVASRPASDGRGEPSDPDADDDETADVTALDEEVGSEAEELEDAVADDEVVADADEAVVVGDAGVEDEEAVVEDEVVADANGAVVEDEIVGEADGAVVEQSVVAEADETVVIENAVGGEDVAAEPDEAPAEGVVTTTGDGGEPVEEAPRGDEHVNAAAPDAAVADDLKRITGIGPKVVQRLNAEGIRTYRHLALLDDAAVEDLASRDPRLVARLRRGGWIAQARRLHVESYGSSP